MNCLFRLIVLIFVVALFGVLVLGYLGFVPVVAGVFGSDHSRDLRVKYTQADMQTAVEKSRAKPVELPSDAPAASSLKLTGSTPMNDSFTGQQLTALVAAHEQLWEYYPVSETQIRINPDGTVESSGILRMDRIYGYAEATGVPREVVDTLIDRLKISSLNPPFYVKGRVSVDNNKVSGDVEEAEIGRFSIPSNWISDNEDAIAGFIENRIEAAGVSAKSVTFTDGAMKFDGTVPETVGFSPAK